MSTADADLFGYDPDRETPRGCPAHLDDNDAATYCPECVWVTWGDMQTPRQLCAMLAAPWRDPGLRAEAEAWLAQLVVCGNPGDVDPTSGAYVAEGDSEFVNITDLDNAMSPADL